MFDAVHHYNVGKCSVSSEPKPAYRKRRDDEFNQIVADFEMIKSEIADEFSERGIIGDELKTAYAAKPEIVNRLENLCRRSMNSVWKERILTVHTMMNFIAKHIFDLSQDPIANSLKGF